MNRKIEVNPGINASIKVLDLMKKDRKLKNVFVAVDAMSNGREQGLAFWVSSLVPEVLDKEGKATKWQQVSFTWCVYEHRNSDQLILNGKEGIRNSAGDLPYMTDNKYDYIACFDYNDFRGVEKRLVSEILAFYKKYPDNR